MIAGKSFWDNPEKTTAILKERTLLSTKVGGFNCSCTRIWKTARSC